VGKDNDLSKLEWKKFDAILFEKADLIKRKKGKELWTLFEDD